MDDKITSWIEIMPWTLPGPGFFHVTFETSYTKAYVEIPPDDAQLPVDILMDRYIRPAIDYLLRQREITLKAWADAGIAPPKS